MIWTDPFETFEELRRQSGFAVHPAYASPAGYNPVWHAVQASFDHTQDDGGIQ